MTMIAKLKRIFKPEPIVKEFRNWADGQFWDMRVCPNCNKFNFRWVGAGFWVCFTCSYRLSQDMALWDLDWFDFKLWLESTKHE